MSCTAFRWGASPVGGPRAGILVPVRVGDRTLEAHLDLGADQSVLFHAPNDSAPRPGVRAPVSIAGAPPLERDLINVAAGVPYDANLALDWLVGTVVLIDYPGQVICVSTSLPENEARRFNWVNAEIRSNRLFVPLSVDGEPHEDFNFDPGSPFGSLNTDFELWTRLTGLSDPMAAPDQRTVRMDGQPFVLVGAPMRGRLQIGEARIDAPVVFTIPGLPHHHRDDEIARAGYFGNHLFLDRVVALDLREQPRFGLSTSSRSLH